MAKLAINASGIMLLPSLVQVSESISGTVVPLAMFTFTNYDGEVIDHTHTNLSLLYIENAMGVDDILYHYLKNVDLGKLS